MKYGLTTMASAIPALRVADVEYNTQQIESLIAQAEGRGAEIIVFPELSLTGSSCQDLFRQQVLLDKAEESLLVLLDFTRKLDIIAVVGLPVRIGALLYDCAAVIQHGSLLGIVAKTFIPIDNQHIFASAAGLAPQDIYLAGSPVHVTGQPQLFRTCDGAAFGIEIGEDAATPLAPANRLALAGADIILCLASDNEQAGRYVKRSSMLLQQSACLHCGYLYSSCGYGESTQDVVHGGMSVICENGRILTEATRFSMEPQLLVAQIDIDRVRHDRQVNPAFRASMASSMGHAADASGAHVIDCKPITPRDFELIRPVSAHPFLPCQERVAGRCEEILDIQTLGLCRRLQHTHCDKAVIGISGGLDSTLALLVTVRAFDRLGLPRQGIIGITMPGFGTSDRTHRNAVLLMDSLGVTQREISIAKAVTQHFEDIGHDAAVHDVTYENAQARERTQILMDVANQVGALVIGTGDLSELALGWCTYNGDHMSMYDVNAGVPKTLIQHIIRHVAENGDASSLKPQDSNLKSALLDVVDTPISPELTPADAGGNIQQRTEDLVGPYELHDFFLYYLLRWGFRPQKILLLARKAFDGKYDDDTLHHWLQTFCRRFFSQQFKRSCMPDGPKVGSVGLSPRGDWHMPSDAMGTLWLKDLE